MVKVYFHVKNTRLGIYDGIKILLGLSEEVLSSFVTTKLILTKIGKNSGICHIFPNIHLNYFCYRHGYLYF